MLLENNVQRKEPLKVFWEKDVFLKIAARKVKAVKIAVKILKKYLLRGSFLVKLKASSLMSKKITKIMHE